MKTCFLFPGQGAQYSGMGKDLWEASDTVKSMFAMASDISEVDLPSVLFEGTDEDLKATDVTQVAITVVNLASALVLQERGVRCDGAAGFSLGEYTALCLAGVFSQQDLFRLVKNRGDVMERASRALDDDNGSPGMVAVLGLDLDTITQTLAAGGVEGAYIANYNSPTQIVLSGTHQGLEAAEGVLKNAGAKRVIRLKVSGPFHSPLLEPAKIAFAETLDAVEFKDPVLPVYSNVSGKAIGSGVEARELCAQQIVSPVLWVDEELSVLADSYTHCIEAGPGKVLSGLWKSISADIPCVLGGTIEKIDEIGG